MKWRLPVLCVFGVVLACGGEPPSGPGADTEPKPAYLDATGGMVSAGTGFTCAISATQAVFCWGLNQNGQLGNGGVSNHTCEFGPCKTFAAPAQGLRATAVSVSGAEYACAIELLGAAYCWGSNRLGYLGTGNYVDKASPTPVATALRFTSVSSGGGHTCALATTGNTFCWGEVNEYGELGTGTAGNCGYGVPGACISPALVDGGIVFASLSAGSDHTCGVAAGARGYCWGYPAAGRLGIQRPAEGPIGQTCSLGIYCELRPALVDGNLAFRALSAGNIHTCGLTVDGIVYCWGSNENGQLGNGGNATQGDPTPTPVATQLRFSLVSAGYDHTCALTADGTAFCWGSNARGQLGNGSPPPLQSLIPVPVAGALVFAALAAGTLHTCGITPVGAVYCWGANPFGQLGDGSTMDRRTPVRVRRS